MTTALETISSLKPVNLNRVTREDLRAYFVNAWELQDALFGSLTTEGALSLRPDPLRNPLVFYLGHPAAFYVNKLRMAGLLEDGINPEMDGVFAAGVDPDTPAELEAALGGTVWPDPDEVWAYRSKCFESVLDVIERVELDLPVTPDAPAWALLMGIEHDRIHFETSSVLFRQLPERFLRRPEGWQYAPTLGDPPRNAMIGVPGATVSLGKPQGFPTYGWDNEYGALDVEVMPFRASRYLISNREYLAFVEAGGYSVRQYWDDESWAWRIGHAVTRPRFWVELDGVYYYRTLFELIAMPWDWPVEVNHHEAAAFCRWRGDGARLLTEAEWNLVAGDRDRAEYDDDHAFGGRYNLNLRFGSPSPVHLLEEARNRLGFYDALGNVWVWLSDDFRPLPGFRTHPLYEDFSLPFFDVKHSMLLGGSWATTGTGASRFYRLWFRRHFYQHAGFRVAES